MKAYRLKAMQAVKRVIRNPYAFPGGYAVNLLMSDGELLCPQCAKENFRLICRATLQHDATGGWEAMSDHVHWEGPDEQCAHCGRPLPSEYGIPEGQQEQ